MGLSSGGLHLQSYLGWSNLPTLDPLRKCKGSLSARPLPPSRNSSCGQPGGSACPTDPFEHHHHQGPLLSAIPITHLVTTPSPMAPGQGRSDPPLAALRLLHGASCQL